MVNGQLVVPLFVYMRICRCVCLQNLQRLSSIRPVRLSKTLNHLVSCNYLSFFKAWCWLKLTKKSREKERERQREKERERGKERINNNHNNHYCWFNLVNKNEKKNLFHLTINKCQKKGVAQTKQFYFI